MTDLQLICTASFLCNLPVSGGCTWFGGHTWSLAYEEQFYVLFPLLFILFVSMLRKGVLFLFLLPVFFVISMLTKFTDHLLVSIYLNNMSFLLIGVVAALYKNEVSIWISNYKLITSNSIWVIMLILLFAIVIATPDKFESAMSILVYPFFIAYLVLATPVKSKFSRFFSRIT